MAEQDKDIKTKIHNNAKTAKRNDVKTEKPKEIFEDHFKGTAVDPDLDPNLDLNVAQQLPDVEESHQDENIKSHDIPELGDEVREAGTDFAAEKKEERAQVLLEKDLSKQGPQNLKVKFTKYRTGYFFLTLTLFLIGFW